ncbi:MAG: hypothetical protein IKN12_08015, partial [Selenomonadaceae bacterium]|nr:hypothetical protein [Selenomonadaceae bacterium]
LKHPGVQRAAPFGGVKGQRPLQVLEKHRSISVANASHAKASQEQEPKAKRDWQTLTAGTESQQRKGRKDGIYGFKQGGG